MTHADTTPNAMQCQMTGKCTAPVTHIGNKGYIYCTEHALDRRSSRYEQTRAMRPWEVALLATGESLPSYDRKRKPAPVQLPHPTLTLGQGDNHPPNPAN